MLMFAIIYLFHYKIMHMAGIPIRPKHALLHLDGELNNRILDDFQTERLELAAAQFAVCLAAAKDESEVELLEDRIKATGDDFQADQYLTPRELEFLPAARTILALAHLAGSDLFPGR
jgi:hypothetical protein